MSMAIDLLASNPLLLLLVVAAIGFPLGRIRIGGASLGVAAVLFVGLAVGTLDQRLRLPELIYQLGLVFFVYTMGISSGRNFFASFRGRGLGENIFAVLIILMAGALTLGASFLLNSTAAQTAGLFTGVLTNTPALAGVIERLGAAGVEGAALADPVVGYSLAYPVSVLGIIFAMLLAKKIGRIDYTTERSRPEARALGVADPEITNLTIRVTRTNPGGSTVRELQAGRKWNVVFARVEHEGKVSLATEHTPIHTGDIVSVVGSKQELERVSAYLGEPAAEHIEFDRSEFDTRRILVSNPNIVGRRLRDLQLPLRFGAMITRLRHGDIDTLPTADSVLDLGDRVRVITARENMPAVTRFFGDSYRAISEIDIMSFSLGLALGLLLGLVPIPLPGGITIKLGIAGGPLIVALLLGWRGRTGPIVWTLPYSANLMLRQVGLVLFLAGVGTRSGFDFYHTLISGNGALILLAATAVVAIVALVTLWVGYKLLNIPMGILLGILSGIQTQPATLAFALEQSEDDLPNLGYATVYPMAMIVKIILAQLILVWLGT